MTEAIQALKSENKMTDELIQRFNHLIYQRLDFPCVHVEWDNGRDWQKDLVDFEEALKLIHYNKIEAKEYAGLLMEAGHPSIDKIFESVAGRENDGSQEDADLLQDTLVAFIENELKGMGK